MAVDRFEVVVDPGTAARRSDDREVRRVELRVNGVGLIDLVRAAELPHALREHEERIAAGVPADDLGLPGALAGDYLYISPDEVFLPSRNLLGEPYLSGSRRDPDDPRWLKSLLLGCTCGITDCWPLLAAITVSEPTVTWSDFCQLHRDWVYDLGPFVFDRRQYEFQLVRPTGPPT